ncbi:hypothetical protein EXN66_Car013339 [Channa argus]|uniref:Uncharacterized protein n=1 Tax=Channa argus TaxID=215402 RepID=A0A6G1Q5E2_CHAAH|nr:hypothetical protein EXN66_Car013339 [Channa argus]
MLLYFSVHFIVQMSTLNQRGVESKSFDNHGNCPVCHCPMIRAALCHTCTTPEALVISPPSSVARNKDFKGYFHPKFKLKYSTYKRALF